MNKETILKQIEKRKEELEDQLNEIHAEFVNYVWDYYEDEVAYIVGQAKINLLESIIEEFKEFQNITERARVTSEFLLQLNTQENERIQGDSEGGVETS